MDFLGELKKFKQSKNGNVVRPEVVKNADNPENIVNEFKQVYKTLYNSTPSDLDEVKGTS